MAHRCAVTLDRPAARSRRGAARPGALLALVAALAVAGPARAAEVSAPPRAIARDSMGFEAALAEHGDWVQIARWGRAWRPSRVEEGWRPYIHGSWTYTEDGWFWVTDEPWGFATYHYGRWLYDGAYGWVWVPGRTWAPAWVAWRWDAEVVGWAPLPPEGKPSLAFWTFVPARKFVGERAETNAFSPALVPALWARTRPPAPGASAAVQRLAPPSQRAGRRG